MNFIERYNIGDNVVLFYLASIIREILITMDNDDLNNAILSFIFNSGENNEEV